MKIAAKQRSSNNSLLKHSKGFDKYGHLGNGLTSKCLQPVDLLLSFLVSVWCRSMVITFYSRVWATENAPFIAGFLRMWGD